MKLIAPLIAAASLIAAAPASAATPQSLPHPCKFSARGLESMLHTSLKHRWNMTNDENYETCFYGARNPDSNLVVPFVQLQRFSPEGSDTAGYWFVRKGKRGLLTGPDNEYVHAAHFRHDGMAGHDGYYSYERDRGPTQVQDSFRADCIPASADPHTRVSEGFEVLSMQGDPRRPQSIRDAHLSLLACCACSATSATTRNARRWPVASAGAAASPAAPCLERDLQMGHTWPKSAWPCGLRARP